MDLRRFFGRLLPARDVAPDTRALVATCTNVREVLGPVLSRCPVDFVCDMDDGRRALAQRAYTHVVVGYLFAESHMFEFARHARKVRPGARVVCVKVIGRRLSPIARFGLNEAVLSLGCEGFFDLSAGHLPEALFRRSFDEVLARAAPRTPASADPAVIEALRGALHRLRERA